MVFYTGPEDNHKNNISNITTRTTLTDGGGVVVVFSDVKVVGMLFVPFRGWESVFWSHLGCARMEKTHQQRIMASFKVLHQNKTETYNYRRRLMCMFFKQFFFLLIFYLKN